MRAYKFNGLGGAMMVGHLQSRLTSARLRSRTPHSTNPKPHNIHCICADRYVRELRVRYDGPFRPAINCHQNVLPTVSSLALPNSVHIITTCADRLLDFFFVLFALTRFVVSTPRSKPSPQVDFPFLCRFCVKSAHRLLYIAVLLLMF